MLVSSFMVPAEKATICHENNTIGSVLEVILEKNISAIVVLNDQDIPAGICTKTDFVRAYQKGVGIDEKVGYIMSSFQLTDACYVQDMDSRDTAAASFEQKKIHHALVQNKEGKWVGLISSWDIAAECMKDAKAWPWIRNGEGPRPFDAFLDARGWI